MSLSHWLQIVKMNKEQIINRPGSIDMDTNMGTSTGKKQ